MKKIFVLVFIGVVLLAGGIWWYLATQDNPFTSDSSVPAVQDLDISRDSLAGKVLLSTEEGLRVVDPETGAVASLHKSFDRITAPTQYWGQTTDEQYWLFMTRTEAETEESLPQYDWYVVNWPEQKLQSLADTLDVSYLTDKIWYSVAWGRGSVVSGAFVAQERPDVALQPYTLTTLDLATLQQEEFGVVSASQLDMIGVQGTGVQTELFAQVTRETTGEIISRTANSLQNTVISEDGGSFLQAEQAHGTAVARYTGDQVELLDLANPDEVLGVITPLSGRRIASTQWWSSSGEVFALAHFSTADPADQTIVFYAANGTVLHQVDVTGSVEVSFSADGTQAMLSITSDSLAAAADVTLTDKQYLFVSVFSAESTPVSSIPENTLRVLGVL